MPRQIFLDTETTGFDYKNGHRIIEFGAVEMINRKLTSNDLHFYFKPDIEVEEGALRVHGLSNDFLSDKPLFGDKVDEIIKYLSGAEVIIHNAGFDVPFLNSELKRLKNNTFGIIEDHVDVTDSLIMARKKHPGQRNSLDALCKRYGINNDHRVLHGALLDAQILADVYLAMTGGQTDLVLFEEVVEEKAELQLDENTFSLSGSNLKTVLADAHAEQAHQDYLNKMAKKNGVKPLWSGLL